MKISYAEYLKKTDASVLVAEAIFSELFSKFPLHKISDVADTTSGGTPLRSNAEYHNGTIPWLKSGELNDKWIEEAEEFITEEGLSNSSAKLLPEGTLLLAMYGATAGRTGITRIKAATNQAVCALFPNEKVTQEYLFWFLRQHRYYFIEISKGGAQPNISQSVIKGTLLPVPDKVLQTRIASILSTIESTGRIDLDIVPSEFKGKVNKVLASKNNVLEITTEVNHQLTLVKKLRQQLLQDAVQGKLVQQDRNEEPASELLKKIKAEKEKLISDRKIRQGKIQEAELQNEILFDIPDNWVWCKLDEICLNITDGTHQTPVYTKEGRIFLSAQNVKPFRFMPDEHKYVSESDYKDYIKSRKAEKGDILVARVGAGIGEAAVIDREIEFCFYVSLGLIQHFKEYVSSNYLATVINSPYGVRYSKGNISSKGGSAGNFNLGRIRSFLIPLPPLLEQHRILTKLEELIQTCDQLEASIQISTVQNEQLLQQVLRETLTQ